MALAADLAYFYYPQYRWAKRLCALLPPYLAERETQVVDAPCGDGVVSYWLLRSGKFANAFQLFDRSAESIAQVKRFISAHPAATAAAGDIFTIPAAEPRRDVWLLVNSLYLLPEIDRLVARMRPRFRVIIGIFPHLDRPNIRYYIQRTGHDENINKMDVAETVAFFARHGYRLEHREDVGFISQFRWSGPGLRRLLNLVEPFAGRRQGNYWLGVFGRDEGHASGAR